MKKENTKYTTLLNFIQSKYSYKEYQKIKSWLNKAENDDEVKELFFKHWKEVHSEKKHNTESLDHIFKKISAVVDDNKTSSRFQLWRFYGRIAAIFIIPLISMLLWNFLSENPVDTNQGWVEINVPEGSRVHFILPDSSTGWINGGSKMKYSAKFDHRKVKLTGEAFFNVKHLKNSDFTVDIQEMEVRVLGTKFNVSAYPNEPFKEVVLQEGKVEITDNNQEFQHILLPNEKIRYDRRNRNYELTKVRADRYRAWTKGYLIIDNEPLSTIVKKLERRYNAEIVISNEVLQTYHFKATFYDEPLEEVLRLISITTPITYTIETRNINSSGILKQKKVMIKPK